MDPKQFYRSRSGAVIGAARDIAEEPDEDAARVEQLHGHTADHLFKHNRRGSADQTFLAVVCRRRWPSGRREEASQRHVNLREAICHSKTKDGYGLGGHFWNRAEIAFIRWWVFKAHRAAYCISNGERVKKCTGKIEAREAVNRNFQLGWWDKSSLRNRTAML